ncbi:MAG: 2-oxoacid:acceptor oxidoreductase family protein [bacterium]
MQFRCIFAGFGGQGIVSMGTLLAYAGMTANRQTTFFPSYGIAMRGGNANCTVIVSDDRIASPVVPDPDIMVVMNDASLSFFQSRVLPGGRLFINTSLISRKVERTDLTPVYVQATQMATEGGDSRMANMAMLGALIKVTGMLPLDSLVQAMHKTFPARIHHLIEKNKHVLEMGYASL